MTRTTKIACAVAIAGAAVYCLFAIGSTTAGAQGMPHCGCSTQTTAPPTPPTTVPAPTTTMPCPCATTTTTAPAPAPTTTLPPATPVVVQHPGQVKPVTPVAAPAPVATAKALPFTGANYPLIALLGTTALALGALLTYRRKPVVAEIEADDDA